MESVFLLSVLLIIYTYIGYPVIVYFISKFSFKESNINIEFEPEVSIVITVYNGEKYIERKINNILSSKYPLDKLNIIVISDGSTDSTENILRKYAGQITFLILKDRRGKAACLNDAMDIVLTEYVVFADVRQEFEDNTIHELIAPLSDQDIGAVSGELVFIDENHNPFSKGIDAYWRYEKLIRNSEAKINSVIGVTGAVYSIKKKLYKPIPQGVVLDDVLIPMQVILAGYRVIFNSNAIAYDVPSNDMSNEKRRKIRTLAGNYQLIQLLPALLNPFKNKLFLQFVSHKILRLLAPFFMLSALITNAFLINSGGVFTLLFWIQFISYLSVLFNNKLSLSNYMPFRILNTFVVLNWYSLLAFFEFIKGKKTHLW